MFLTLPEIPRKNRVASLAERLLIEMVNHDDASPDPRQVAAKAVAHAEALIDRLDGVAKAPATARIGYEEAMDAMRKAARAALKYYRGNVADPSGVAPAVSMFRSFLFDEVNGTACGSARN